MNSRKSKPIVKTYETNGSKGVKQVIEAPKSPIEALHAEYLKKPATSAEARRAVRAFVSRKGARALADRLLKEEREKYEARRRELLDALKVSEELLRKASADLVRTHGRAPVEIDGVVYDVSFQPENPKTGGGGYVYWIPRVSRQVPK